jgi:hypothetical protein
MGELEIVAYLRSTQAIRERCGALFELGCQDQLQHFRCDLNQLEAVAQYVIQVMQTTYPDLQVPFHSRWRHFEAGGVPRLTQFDRLLQSLSPLEKAKAKFDLVIPSVLLDAGAGADWQYVEPGTGAVFRRSEGLAVASYHLFLQGGFSSQLGHPLQADAPGLQAFSAAQLAEAFQVSESNPLVGVAGRAELMRQLGQVLLRSPDLFGEPDDPRSLRLGNLVDYLLQAADRQTLNAHTVFDAVLAGFSEIWPGRIQLAEQNLGDVWVHSALLDRGLGSQWVPFHKLSQWLTYSLLEPLQELGLTITGLDQLTGLSEYRNGGLCLDLGLLQAKQDAVTQQPHPPDSEVIVEWRALTLIALDRIAAQIRQSLTMTEQDLPLVKVLEGGTWAAGRKIAAARRAGGTPPIQVISDGTVF